MLPGAFGRNKILDAEKGDYGQHHRHRLHHGLAHGLAADHIALDKQLANHVGQNHGSDARKKRVDAVIQL